MPNNRRIINRWFLCFNSGRLININEKIKNKKRSYITKKLIRGVLSTTGSIPCILEDLKSIKNMKNTKNPKRIMRKQVPVPLNITISLLILPETGLDFIIDLIIRTRIRNAAYVE
jgi:hypothetical protein